MGRRLSMGVRDELARIVRSVSIRVFRSSVRGRACACVDDALSGLQSPRDRVCACFCVFLCLSAMRR